MSSAFLMHYGDESTGRLSIPNVETLRWLYPFQGCISILSYYYYRVLLKSKESRIGEMPL